MKINNIAPPKEAAERIQANTAEQIARTKMNAVKQSAASGISMRVSTVRELALKFSLLLAVIVALFSVGIILLLRAHTRQRQNRELVSAAQSVGESLAEGLVREAEDALPYYITFCVYESGTKEVLATNDPFLPVLPPTPKKALRYTAKNYFSDGDLNILYYARLSASQDFVIETALNMDSDTAESILADLPYILVPVSIPLLIISYIASLFIAKRTMKSVRVMTDAAKKISVSELGGRLPVTGCGGDFDILARTLNDLLSRLQSDFERERQFTADVSHELKTPIAVMLGHANLLRRWGKNDPVQLEKSLSSLIREAHSMEAIVGNLLEISRFENGRITLHAKLIDIPSLFERLAENTKAYAPEASFEKHIGVQKVYADEELLYEACTIVISNSIKFAGKKASIKLFSARSEADGFCDIAISDDGPGIAAGALSHIFERFYREDEAHERSGGGAGLGLSIVKSIMSALGGTVRAESEAGKGCTIVLAVPEAAKET
ncbi:hypothetical protein HMPREF1221_02317 [Treponema socranskii subsp. paredis ATCC 35535]|nr:hypothetical protein HMPREF1221_02317 [Treponema socranskii subsp. paredis ATCC 35535]